MSSENLTQWYEVPYDTEYNISCKFVGGPNKNPISFGVWFNENEVSI